MTEVREPQHQSLFFTDPEIDGDWIPEGTHGTIHVGPGPLVYTLTPDEIREVQRRQPPPNEQWCIGCHPDPPDGSDDSVCSGCGPLRIERAGMPR